MIEGFKAAINKLTFVYFDWYVKQIVNMSVED